MRSIQPLRRQRFLFLQPIGADAQTVQDTVTQVIEQNMNGIDNLMYMSSTSDSAGSVTITLTFQSGTDPDIAQVQVQNKLQLATPLLPQEVQQQGISVEKSSSSFLMVAGFVSDNPNTTQTTSLTMSPLTLRTLSAV